MRCRELETLYLGVTGGLLFKDLDFQFFAPFSLEVPLSLGNQLVFSVL